MSNDSTTTFILTWVTHDARPLTPRLLSRTGNVHLDQAKAALTHFYHANQDSVHATFLLKGLALTPAPTPLPGLPTPAKRSHPDQAGENESDLAKDEPMDVGQPIPTPRETSLFLIVSAAKREAALQRFTKLETDELYSIHPGTNSSPQADASQLVQAGQDARQGDALTNWEASGRGATLGAITNPEMIDCLSKADRTRSKPCVVPPTATSKVSTSKSTNDRASVPSTSKLTATTTTTTEAPSAGTGGRGKRKVIKREKTKDAKGKTRVQDVEVWESCSESEADPIPTTHKPTAAPLSDQSAPRADTAPSQPAPPPPPKPPVAKKTYSGPPKKAQQSLSSFFGKKK